MSFRWFRGNIWSGFMQYIVALDDPQATLLTVVVVLGLSKYV
jgi:hypothetical protein